MKEIHDEEEAALRTEVRQSLTPVGGAAVVIILSGVVMGLAL